MVTEGILSPESELATYLVTTSPFYQDLGVEGLRSLKFFISNFVSESQPAFCQFLPIDYFMRSNVLRHMLDFVVHRSEVK